MLQFLFQHPQCLSSFQPLESRFMNCDELDGWDKWLREEIRWVSKMESDNIFLLELKR